MDLLSGVGGEHYMEVHLHFILEKKTKISIIYIFIYIYRTLLKCISTHGSRKGFRIRTVPTLFVFLLHFLSLFIPILYFFSF